MGHEIVTRLSTRSWLIEHCASRQRRGRCERQSRVEPAGGMTDDVDRSARAAATSARASTTRAARSRIEARRQGRKLDDFGVDAEPREASGELFAHASEVGDVAQPAEAEESRHEQDSVRLDSRCR